MRHMVEQDATYEDIQELLPLFGLRAEFNQTHMSYILDIVNKEILDNDEVSAQDILDLIYADLYMRGEKAYSLEAIKKVYGFETAFSKEEFFNKKMREKKSYFRRQAGNHGIIASMGVALCHSFIQTVSSFVIPNPVVATVLLSTFIGCLIHGTLIAPNKPARQKQWKKEIAKDFAQRQAHWKSKNSDQLKSILEDIIVLKETGSNAPYPIAFKQRKLPKMQAL